MKKSLLSLCFLSIMNISVAQTYTYDNNHQLIGIQYDNGITVVIQYDANGNRISLSTSGGPLPVTLLSFNAQKSGLQVLLTWTTSEEINTDKFEIEYSKDANNFFSFVTVPAKGNSSVRSNYSTIHCCPVEGVNYYRLKMIDKDGIFKYSEIRKVVFEFVNVMKVYPNPSPSKSTLNISFIKAFTQDGTITIYNSNGALMYNSILSKGKKTTQVNTSSFSAGSYYVAVSVEGEIYKEKFIKQ